MHSSCMCKRMTLYVLKLSFFFLNLIIVCACSRTVFMCVCLYSGNRVPLTLVLTEQAIYLGKENFAQWPLPKVQELPKRDDLKPPFSNVIRKNINDVEQIVSFFTTELLCADFYISLSRAPPSSSILHKINVQTSMQYLILGNRAWGQSWLTNYSLSQ